MLTYRIPAWLHIRWPNPEHDSHLKPFKYRWLFFSRADMAAHMASPIFFLHFFLEFLSDVVYGFLLFHRARLQRAALSVRALPYEGVIPGGSF